MFVLSPVLQAKIHSRMELESTPLGTAWSDSEATRELSDTSNIKWKLYIEAT